MIIASVLIGLAIAGLAYLAYRVTVSLLKKYKKKKQSKIVMANMGDLIKNIPDKEKRTMSFDDLENIEDETIIAEYDEDADEVVQADFVNQEKGMDRNIEIALSRNDGMFIID
ncbi:MAG: hypothetical protein ACI4JM_08775 [Oscillospiraceae bacterium]